MNSRVRIIKRDRSDSLQSSPLGQDEKTARQSEREIASTVKNWIAELAQQRRADEHRFLAQRRNGAKEVFRNAVALCVFAPLREKPSQ